MSLYLIGTLNGEPYTFTPQMGLYPDNTPYAKGLPDKDAIITDAIIRQHNLQDFVASLWYLAAISYAGFIRDPQVDLFVPFWPCARQDRSNLEGDVLRSKYETAYLIKPYLYLFKNIYTIDIHSNNDVPPWIPIKYIQQAVIVYNQMRKEWDFNPTEGYYDLIVAPDEGARKRAEDIGAMFTTPVAVAEKHRDLATGKILSYRIDTSESAAKKILVVDDICDGGATFEILADSLPVDSEKHLFVTHGLFTRGTKHLLKKYDSITTTNSTETHPEGVRVLDLFGGNLP